MNIFSQIRKISPFSTIVRLSASNQVPESKDFERNCWSCLKRISCHTFFCQCGKVQNFCPSWSYFDYFGFAKPTMNIDLKELSNLKRSLQKDFHPDRFVRSTKREMEIASTLSSQVNDAFKVLSNPITRAEYILTLNGNPCSSEDTAITDNSFLADVLELNERVDDLTEMVKTEKCEQTLMRVLAALHSIVMTRWGAEMDDLVRLIEAGDWNASHQALSRLRYYERLKNRLRELKPDFATRGIKTPFD